MCDSDHSSSAFFAGALWPFIAPAIAGHLVGRNDRVTRLEKEREKELAAAKHARELEQEKLKEADATVRRLRVLGKDELTKEL